jgi:hypothetical protein
MDSNLVKCLLLVPLLLLLGSAGRAADDLPVTPPPATTAQTSDVTPEVTTEPELPTITRGQTVTVRGTHLPTRGVSVVLRTGKKSEKTGNQILPIPAEVKNDGSSLTFKVPTEHFYAGRYLISVKVDSTELAVPGELRVIPDEARIELVLQSRPRCLSTHRPPAH